MNKIMPIIGVLLLAAILVMTLGFVPAGDPAPQQLSQVIATASPAASGEAGFDTIAKQAVVIDAATGAVLLDKDANTPMPTASMSKVMTLYMVFDAIKQGRISLSDTFTVSERAWKMEGSKMFIQVGTQVSVEDLIRGVAIQSGNDAAVALAEGVGGTEEDFARLMTARAKEIGMTNSNFANASGWPDPNHHSTAHDLAVLAYRTVADFPEFYHYFGEREFTYNNITQQNRDPLLGRLAGADGLKTGHTEEAGYGLIGSAQRDGRRVIMVINGLDSMKSRADEGVRIMEWAFRNFELKTIFAQNQEAARVPVWLGDRADVVAVAEKDVKALLPRIGGGQVGINVVIDAPVHAPVKKGDVLGVVQVTMPDGKTEDVNLLAGEDVNRIGFFGRIGARLSNLVGGGPDVAADEDSAQEETAVEAAPATVAPPAPTPAPTPAPVETAPEAEGVAAPQTEETAPIE